MLDIMCNIGGLDSSVSYDARSQQWLFVIMCQVRTRELEKKTDREWRELSVITPGLIVVKNLG